MWLHSRRLEDSLSANSVIVQDYVAAQTRALGSSDSALRMIDNTIQIQALTMTYADLFWLLAVGICIISPLIFFLRPLPTNAPPVQAH